MAASFHYQVQRHGTGPTLVPRKAARPGPLALWHLLSLDAPTVAALWTISVARSVSLHLRWTSPAAMFVAVWMIYAGDRILDARNAPAEELEERHRFHQRHRAAFLAGIALSAAVLGVLLVRLDQQSLRLYALLATLLGAYLLLIHARASSLRLPKELAVGVFFAAAVFIPTVARAPHLRLGLLPAAALFAAVCTLNCLFLYAWEHPGHKPQAHGTTRWATGHLPHLTAATVVAALLSHGQWTVTLACAISALLLLALHCGRRLMSPVHLRAAADLTLLTPLLFLWRG